MSPWGGYAGAKTKRIAFGQSQGYETNAGGFSMAGANYGNAFREVCLRGLSTRVAHFDQPAFAWR